MRIKLTIQYLGTHYSGWQSQSSGNTVQDKVEQALSKYFDGKQIRIYGAGRTDVGVHAEGQVAHFDTDSVVNTYKLCLGVNCYLPDDIAIANAEIVDDDFDARFGAVSKTYRYRLYVSPTRRPLSDINSCQIYKPLNIEQMKKTAQLFVGTHDFKNFQKTGSNLVGTVRTINSLEVVEQPNNRIDIVINGNAFLYNMVRIISGTLVAVGSGKKTMNDVKQMLDGQLTRKDGGKTLPSHGLTLEKIYY